VGQQTLRKRLLAAGRLRETLPALRNGQATEANALLGVEDGALPHKALNATRTAIHLVESYLVDDLGAMLSVQLD
jgi:hypothetical protein